MNDNLCANSKTPLRRILVSISPKKPPRWLSSRMVWRLYGFLEWSAHRAQDLAMEMEDREMRE